MKKMKKMAEFFVTFWALIIFAIKSLWVLLREDMNKEAQTYKEEREEQKKTQNKKRRK